MLAPVAGLDVKGDDEVLGWAELRDHCALRRSYGAVQPRALRAAYVSHRNTRAFLRGLSALVRAPWHRTARVVGAVAQQVAGGVVELGAGLSSCLVRFGVLRPMS